MSLFFLTLLFCVALGSRTVKVTVNNCTKETDEAIIQELEVSPSKQHVGQNFTIFGKGIPKVNILNGIFNTTAQWIGIPVYSISGNACEPNTIVLPLDVGEIYYEGTQCPIKQNEEVPVSIKGIGLYTYSTQYSKHIHVVVISSSGCD